MSGNLLSRLDRDLGECGRTLRFQRAQHSGGSGGDLRAETEGPGEQNAVRRGDCLHGIDRAAPLIDLLVRVADVDNRALDLPQHAEQDGVDVLSFVHQDVVRLRPWSGKSPQLEVAVMAERKPTLAQLHRLPDRLDMPRCLPRQNSRKPLEGAFRADPAAPHAEAGAPLPSSAESAGVP